MVSRKALAWALLAWGLSGTSGRGDVLTNAGNSGNWVTFEPDPNETWIPPSTTTTTISTTASTMSTNASSSSPSSYNAFVNLGSATFPDASAITSGNAQPWYDSPAITGFFGGQPTAQQQASFDSTVMQRIEQTFQQSGVSVNLTDDPSQAANALHTLSLVSNTSAKILPNAIGMTFVGGSGFSFIDQEAQAASSLDQLQWIVAHNISHELMLAFGVTESYDTTGNYVDARNANFAMLTSPNSTFSTAAAQALNQALANGGNGATGSSPLAQVIDPSPVPEPATLAIWGMIAVAGLTSHRRAGLRRRDA